MNFLLGLIAHPTVIKGLLISGLIAGGFVYYKYNQNLVERLRTEKSLLDLQVSQQKKAIESIQRDFKIIIENRQKLEKELEASRKESEKLRETLFRENQGKASLEELARARPGLVERRVNDATNNVFRCFEKLSAGESC